MRNACTALFPHSTLPRALFPLCKELCLVAQWPPGMYILVYSSVCYAPHNVSHYSSWLFLCSLVEALKINEAFVLNQEAIYEYSSTYNKLCRLLFLSLHYQRGGGQREWCFLSKREKKEQKRMMCDFLAYKQFPNWKTSTLQLCPQANWYPQMWCSVWLK